jgi:hypothetical protein
MMPEQTGVSDIHAGGDQQGGSKGRPLHLEFSSTSSRGLSWMNFVFVSD